MSFIFRSLALVVLVIWPALASAQERCLPAGRIQELQKQIATTDVQPEDKKLGEEMVTAAKELSDALIASTRTTTKDAKAEQALAALRTVNTDRVCSLLRGRSWPKTSAVGKEGVAGFFYLIAKALPLSMQLELYPIVANAFERGEIEPGELVASYVDRLRLALGRRQLYGTQATIADGFLVMAPIERAEEVDKRRAAFKLQPLRAYERFLEVTYKLPLIRGVMEPLQKADQQIPQSEKTDGSTALEADGGEAPVINVETAFVSIDVNIPDTADAASATLEKGDFKLFDNGKPVEIETFARAETPFDIVLLLDLSGSTADKVGLIKKTTRRFVEMKRPGDRVAVVAFNHEQTVVSELEADQKILLERVKKIGGSGGSYVWDAVKFGIDTLEKKSEKGRRKAIVLMSDGVDNLLGFYGTMSPRMGFADLVERIQNSSVTIFPIYLDTEGPNSQRIYEAARRTLRYMADQSGGTVYTAKKLDDLTGIYDRVLKGVGTVYTLGFTPDVESADRRWRTVKVEVASRPELKLRHRPGYFVR